MILLAFGICLLLGIIVVSAEFTSIVGYHNSLEVSCSSTDECVVKNVENCCGYLPKCVHRDAKLNPEIVDELCKDFDDECGSKFLIGYCSCQGESSTKKKCVGHYGTPTINCGDGNCFEVETLESNLEYCPEDCDVNLQEIEEIKQEIEEKENKTEDEDDTGLQEPPVTEGTEEIPPDTGSETDKATGKTTAVIWIIIIIIIMVVVVGIVFWQLKIRRKKASTIPFQ